jgi:hypothetical protein
MDKCLIAFIILLLILLWISHKIRTWKSDSFDNVANLNYNSPSKSPVNSNISFYDYGGIGNGAGIKLENIKSGLNSYDDKTFDDVKEYISDLKDFGNSGLMKCLQGCKGTCVPFGPTGDAHCYPDSWQAPEQSLPVTSSFRNSFPNY